MAKSRFNRKYNISVRKRSNDDARSTADFIEVADHINEGSDLAHSLQYVLLQCVAFP